MRDEIVNLGRPAGRFQLVRRGLGPGVKQVLADAGVEEERVLRDHADLGRQGALCHFPNVVVRVFEQLR